MSAGFSRILTLLTLALVAAASASAAPSGEELYRSQIQTALKQKCLGCHGQANTFGKLDLRTREAALKGGQRGPAIKPGDAASSLLMGALSHETELKMPPGDDAKLDAATIEAFGNWIDAGAPFVALEAASIEWDGYKHKDLWAFQPVQKPAPPYDAVDPLKVRTPIDAFILRRLDQAKIVAAPRADRRTLIRRATVDLIGLPPTPEEVGAFVNDPASDDEAWKRVVERLLASPHYGERWGRHWLDVVRYSDTAGYSNDFERPNAWRYRDYVIRAFNSDKPYDSFIEEQIAGDELYPKDPEALIAVGFLRSGPWEHTGMSVAAVNRQLFLDDVTHNTVQTFMALSLGCAKCHDHKFDPIPTKDYYRVQAAFATTAFARRPVPFLENELRNDFAPGKQRMQDALAETKARLDEFDRIRDEALMKRYGVNRIEDIPKDASKGLGLAPKQKEAQKLYGKHQSMYKESVLRYEPYAFSVSSGLIEDYNDVGPNGAKSYLKKPDYENTEMHVLIGGAIEAPGERVSPGALEALERYGKYKPPEFPETVSGRRSALARWIADKENPLTARVMVNRVWQQHFGRGVAEDSNNFGKMGKAPTHPQLLDWLATFFIESGWSVKSVHRVIMLSEAYQRSSEHDDAETLETKDPENRLLARFSPRRIEAEVMRDAMLAVSGELSDLAGGPGTRPQINRDVAAQPRHAMGSLRPVYYASPAKRERNRRSVYSFTARSLVDPMIETFNGPSLDISCNRRDATTVPLQAFSLFNSEVSYDLAVAFALRLERDRGELDARIRRAFELAYGRAPGDDEVAAARSHVVDMTAYHRRTPPPPKPERKVVNRSITSELTGEEFPFREPPPDWKFEDNTHLSEVGPETRALADLALVLFNSNEFAYVY